MNLRTEFLYGVIVLTHSADDAGAALAVCAVARADCVDGFGEGGSSLSDSLSRSS